MKRGDEEKKELSLRKMLFWYYSGKKPAKLESSEFLKLPSFFSRMLLE